MLKGQKGGKCVPFRAPGGGGFPACSFARRVLVRVGVGAKGEGGKGRENEGGGLKGGVRVPFARPVGCRVSEAEGGEKVGGYLLTPLAQMRGRGHCAFRFANSVLT